MPARSKRRMLSVFSWELPSKSCSSRGDEALALGLGSRVLGLGRFEPPHVGSYSLGTGSWVKSFCGALDFHQHDAVRRDRGGEFLVEPAQILLPPEVPHELLAGKFQIVPAGSDGCRLVAEIEQADSLRAIVQVLGEDAQVFVGGDTGRRFAERILVPREDFVVA